MNAACAVLASVVAYQAHEVDRILVRPACIDNHSLVAKAVAAASALLEPDSS